MLFWFKHLSAALVLIIVGIYLVFFFDPSSLSDDDTKASIQSSSNAAAAGLSRFYGEIKSKMNNPFEEERSTYVIELEAGDYQPLDTALAELQNRKNPVSGKWIGSVKAHRFEKGTTLKNELEQIAIDEKMNLIWALPRDFVVKNPIREDQNTLGTLYKIVTAIDSDFEMDVFGYMCPKERALIVIESKTDYLKRYCVEASSRHLR
ncbi:TcpQ domain-containing protein [Catenovulum sp. SM1970]|uniref:TcpQ domain-containing protein n=1 Tax=Marinifaba aquimaris TaxID=2741323 RepID=UPI0015726FCD|nr:TcpQ domain-containing protein [Marinifaba aquimaris]NTS77687.1 TcpQ domain-containing protein [Marinifaba aquimaris]